MIRSAFQPVLGRGRMLWSIRSLRCRPHHRRGSLSAFMETSRRRSGTGWERRLLPKLRPGHDLKVGVTFELTADGAGADPLLADLRQILDDLQLGDRIRIDVE